MCTHIHVKRPNQACKQAGRGLGYPTKSDGPWVPHKQQRGGRMEGDREPEPGLGKGCGLRGMPVLFI